MGHPSLAQLPRHRSFPSQPSPAQARTKHMASRHLPLSSHYHLSSIPIHSLQSSFKHYGFSVAHRTWAPMLMQANPVQRSAVECSAGLTASPSQSFHPTKHSEYHSYIPSRAQSTGWRIEHLLHSKRAGLLVLDSTDMVSGYMLYLPAL